MKRKIVAVIISILLISVCLSLTAFAQVPEKVVLDNSIFYAEIPDNYMYGTDHSDNFYIIDSDFGSQTLEFFVQGNLMFPEGASDAEDEEIISKVKRITQWSSSFSVTELTREVVNGQKSVIIKGTDELLFGTSIEYYVFNTKEAVCVVGVSYSTEEEKLEIQKIMDTFVMNGTYFEGDAPVLRHDFSNSPDYYEAVEENAQAYYDYYEEFDATMWGIVGTVGVMLLLGPAIVIALIVFIILWSKKKKLVKEYESYFGPIFAVRNAIRAQQMQQNGYMMGNPQPVNPYAQPYQSQPYQPQPMSYGNQPYQPMTNQQPTNQAPLINGIPQDDNKQ